MEVSVAVVLSMAVAYVLGSFPAAYLVARRHGVNIHEIGTRIAGAANVYRNVGPSAGIAVFLVDLGKGAAAVVFAHLLGAEGSLALPALAFAILAHGYPAFGRFPSGAGLATLSGGAAAIGGWTGLIGLVVGVAMVFVLRNTGNGAGLGFVVYLVAGAMLGLSWWTIGGVLALAAAVLVGAKVRERRRAALP